MNPTKTKEDFLKENCQAGENPRWHQFELYERKYVSLEGSDRSTAINLGFMTDYRESHYVCKNCLNSFFERQSMTYFERKSMNTNETPVEQRIVEKITFDAKKPSWPNPHITASIVVLGVFAIVIALYYFSKIATTIFELAAMIACVFILYSLVYLHIKDR